jgi:hypothetical protein
MEQWAYAAAGNRSIDPGWIKIRFESRSRWILMLSKNKNAGRRCCCWGWSKSAGFEFLDSMDINDFKNKWQKMLPLGLD